MHHRKLIIGRKFGERSHVRSINAGRFPPHCSLYGPCAAPPAGFSCPRIF